MVIPCGPGSRAPRRSCPRCPPPRSTSTRACCCASRVVQTSDDRAVPGAFRRGNLPSAGSSRPSRPRSLRRRIDDHDCCCGDAQMAWTAGSSARPSFPTPSGGRQTLPPPPGVALRPMPPSSALTSGSRQGLRSPATHSESSAPTARRCASGGDSSFARIPRMCSCAASGRVAPGSRGGKRTSASDREVIERMSASDDSDIIDIRGSRLPNSCQDWKTGRCGAEEASRPHRAVRGGRAPRSSAPPPARPGRSP